MSCEPFQADLSALLDGDLAEERAEAVREHLGDCLACREERDALANVIEQTHGLERMAAPAEFTAGVMAKLGAPPVAKAVAVGAAAGEPGVLPDVSDAADPCRAFREDLSASVDRALAENRRGEVLAHLVACEPCTLERTELQKIRDRVGSLPRERVGSDFVHGVMEKVEAAEREAAERARVALERRATWFTQLGKLAQAAGFLIVIGGGLFMATPEAHGGRSLPGFSNPPPSGEDFRPQGVDEPQPPETPLPRAEHQWELTVTNLKDSSTATRRLLSAFNRGGRYKERGGEKSVGFFCKVPRNLVDDLHRGLDAAPSVQTTPITQSDMKTWHREQDQVVLKSGFVLVGQVVRKINTVSVHSAGTVHTIARKDVERIEAAGELRDLRLLLHQRD